MCNDVNEIEFVKLAVESAGFYAHVRSTKELGEQLVCASERSDYGYHGTSCWVVFLRGRWILGSFGYRQWQAQNRDDLVRATVEWLSSDSGPGAPPIEIVEARKLREFSDEEFEAFVASKM